MKISTLAHVAVLATFLYCTHKEHEGEKLRKVTATSPIHKDTFVVREYVCQIRASQHIELRALERGYIEKIFVDEGQLVKQGQRMFQIMPLIYQAEYNKALAEVNFVGIEYKNTQRLLDKNIVSENELALMKAKYDKAKAELALAAAHLKFTDVRAPFTGYMDHFHVRLGSLVNDGDLLTTLSDNSKMWVYFNVPEAEYLDYNTSSDKNRPLKVELKMANQKMFAYTGVVETIEADFNNETGNIAFRATFPNPDGLLRHGETGNILVKVAHDNALLIPQKATFEILDKKYVYVIQADTTLKSIRIEVLAELPDVFVVSNNISTKDKILLDGLRLVQEGEKVDVEMKDPNTVIQNLDLHAE